MATAFDHFSAAERFTLGWAGLRGGVPVVLATFPVIAEVPDSRDFFNIAFFAVVISTVLQGSTFEPLAKRARPDHGRAGAPAADRRDGNDPEARRRGDRVPGAPADAIVGRYVRELGLPRDALLNVIVRRGEAIPPRGSTQIEAEDSLHVLVRKEVARQFPALMERWREGPFAPAAERRPNLRGRSVIFSDRPVGGARRGCRLSRADSRAPRVRHLRTRRDTPRRAGALDDGRYAITGRALAVGAAAQIQRYARRRLSGELRDAERAWWQEVVGALAR